MRALLQRLACALIAAAPVYAGAADELSAEQIMEKNFFASKWKSIRYQSHMDLVNHRGEKRTRISSNLAALQPNGLDSKFLVKFSAPNDIRGTSFLQIEHSDGEDDLWIYLPALKKSRRLVANNKKDSFVGSDFSYGDILLPKVSLYRHTLLRSEAVDGHDCRLIESTPVDETVKANSGYSKKLTWVRADNFIEAKVEYYDVHGRLLKTQLIKDHQLVDPAAKQWFAMRREMSNHQTGHKTLIRFDQLQPGVDAPDRLFTMRNLERE